MSQVVKSDVSQSICLEQLRKTLSDIMGLNQITNLVYADQSDISIKIRNLENRHNKMISETQELLTQAQQVIK